MKKLNRNTFLICLTMLILLSCSDRKKNIPITSIESVMTNLAPEFNSFEINSKEENYFEGKKGTAIYIPANTFVFEDGSSPQGNINIELKECYSLTDMISENLTTTSGNEILETGGMIYIKASSNKKELRIQKDKAIVVGYPKEGLDKNMDLFYSIDINDSLSTWIPDYEMYRMEPLQENDSIAKDIEMSASYNYPVEMTDDLYDSKIYVYYYTSTLGDLNLLNHNKTILEFTRDNFVLDDKFKKDDIVINFEFNINKNGKIENIRYEKYDIIHDETLIRKFKKFLTETPAFDMNSESSDVKHDFDYTIGFNTSKYLNQERYKKKFRNKYSDFKNKAIEKMDENSLNYYMFSVTKMGWINCDKFWDLKDGEKTNFVVKVENSADTKVQLIFNDIKSIITGINKDGYVTFNQIPIDKKIKLIGISFKEGKPTMAIAKTTVSKDNFVLTGFNEFSLDELEKELNP